MRQFSHLHLLSIFVTVLFGFLVVSSLWLSGQQRDMLWDAAQQQAQHDLDLMVDTSVEALVKSDFVTVRTFVERWGKSHHAFHSIRFVAPNGYPLAEYTAPSPTDYQTYSFTKEVTIAGTTAATAQITVDFHQSELIAAQLRNRLLLLAAIITLLLGAALWMVIRKMALEPLEKAVARQTLALSEANAELEETNVTLQMEIEERKAAQDALRQREERLSLILNSIDEGIYGVDLQGNCTFCNPAALRQLGYADPNELIGKHMHTLIHHTQKDGTPHAAEECKVYRCFREGVGAYVDDDIFHRADGSAFPVKYSCRPISNNKTTFGAVTVFMDISQRQALEEQLQQAQKMESIGTLAGGIAHDFNNILSAVIGYTDLALMQTKEIPEVQKNLRQVRKAADRAAGLVKQILTFSRKQPQEKLRLQLSPIIKEALKLLRASIPSSIEFRQEITSQGAILADPTQIHQLVMNLCTNASHAMSAQGGILGVSLTEVDSIADGGIIDRDLDLAPGRYLKLSVSDTGCGMSREAMAKIFDPYFTTKEKGRGTGLGLAVVHGIVKEHQGRIAVYSEPGQGTTFNVYLPMIPTETEETEETVIAPALPLARARERIMLVDDEESIRDLTSRFLIQAGYRVDSFAHGVKAWQAFQQTPDHWDLLLTDETMPGMNGSALAVKILELRPDLPIIICSGYSELVGAKELKELGGGVFLQKPVEVSTLLNTVSDVLAVSVCRLPACAPTFRRIQATATPARHSANSKAMNQERKQ